MEKCSYCESVKHTTEWHKEKLKLSMQGTRGQIEAVVRSTRIQKEKAQKRIHGKLW